MNSVSLYAHGTAIIEVGKYGMSLEEAKASFLATCEQLGLKPEVKEKKRGIVFDFGRKIDRRLGELLVAVADIDDLHGDPPSQYTLRDQGEVPPGKYVRTGTYND